ncbi:MAG: hypothetical protein ACXVBI_04495 [Flavisolibacter sp.]
MRANISCRIGIAFLTLMLFSCTKKTETIDSYPFQTERLTELLPLEVGKTFTYRTDSTVFTNFNRNTEIHSYLERDTVDGKFLDGMGRTSFRVTRFLQDSSGGQPWFNAGVFFITPTANTVEISENNLRFVKLTLPMQAGATWKGNLYLPDEPFGSLYNFNNDMSMYKWDYHYTSLQDVFNYQGTPLTGIVTVTGVDNSSLVDTVTVTGNQVSLKELPAVYLRGSATDTIVLTATPPLTGGPTLTVYNRTNQPAKLDGIAVPAGQGRTYELVSGKWTFGSKDQYGNRIDILTSELPYGSRDLMVDQYAKGIGLVYQEFTMWEYQFKFSSTGGDDGTKTGFGVKRRMINHN